jgi:opacity protein-like surface antigen
VWTLTFTPDYALTDHLKIKGEFRYDLVNNSSKEFAEGEDFNQDKDQKVVLVGAEYVF